MLRRTVALFALALLAVTWRLWTPQRLFPQIPLSSWAGGLPRAVDWADFAAMVAALSAILAAPRSSRCWRIASALFIGAFAASVLVDQHRLQPWAYQFAIVLAVLALLPDRRGLTLLRVLTIGIYVHSALSKLDVSFFQTHGQYLVGGLADVAGLELEKWSPTLRRNLAAALPICELAVAFGLCFRKTRFVSLVAAVVMHVLLIAALGPWSLAHEAGVLIWNGYFIVQNVLLFARPTKRGAAASAAPWVAGRAVAAAAIVAPAVLLPFLEPFGLFDAWPSWALYASRPGRLRILVDLESETRLPAELRPYIQGARYADLLRPIRIDRWSLDATGAPIYPSPRFELGVALALSERPGLEDKVVVDIESPADRWTGERSVRRVSGTRDLRARAESFRFNALPRSLAEK